jgi:glycosyltransferase involved in cell wall biosynthesis
LLARIEGAKSARKPQVLCPGEGKLSRPAKIRVAHCIETIHLGGVEQTRLTLARHLDPERFEQMIVCTKALGALPEQFEAAGCSVERIGVFQSKVDVAALARARKLLTHFKPHIVHGGVYEGVITATLAGRAAGVPIVIGEETADPAGRRWTGHLFLRALSVLADRMIGVSPQVSEYLIRSLRIPAEKVVTINNGVIEPPAPSASEVAAVRASMGACPDEIVIGTVGRLFDAHKKTSDVIRALAALRSSYPAVRLLVVGEGPDQPMLQALAGQLGVADRVFFAGYQPNTAAYFGAMDIFVHVPASEAFGLVLVEAMFGGRPIIAGRVGGIPTVIGDDGGILIPSEEPDRLAAELLRLIQDPEARQRLGRRGLERARRHFSHRRYVGDVAKLYEDLTRSKALIS